MPHGGQYEVVRVPPNSGGFNGLKPHSWEHLLAEYLHLFFSGIYSAEEPFFSLYHAFLSQKDRTTRPKISEDTVELNKTDSDVADL